jgi:hypothetical protein
MKTASQRIATVLFEQAVIAAAIVYLLASTPSSKMRNVHFALMLISNISWSIFIVQIPKRQVVLLAFMASAAAFMLSLSDTVWRCKYVHFALKSAGFAVCLVIHSIMRKLSARLNAMTSRKAATRKALTRVKVVLFFFYIVNAVLILVFPEMVAFPTLEICVFTAITLDGW